MKRSNVVAAVAAVALMAACAAVAAAGGVAESAKDRETAPTRQEGAQLAQGYAGLTVVGELKTHKPGVYRLERSNHGTAQYRLLLEIDGQAVEVPGELKEEKLVSSGDPESGEGIRYRFVRKLSLKPGVHKVKVALPDEGIAAEGEVAIAEGTLNTLQVEPVYGAVAGKRRPGFYGATSFLQGIKGLRLSLNEKPL